MVVVFRREKESGNLIYWPMLELSECLSSIDDTIVVAKVTEDENKRKKSGEASWL